ncbi:MAG: hypothetical protein AAFO91_02225 [Bacteroidota bacterium]
MTIHLHPSVFVFPIESEEVAQTVRAWLQDPDNQHHPQRVKVQAALDHYEAIVYHNLAIEYERRIAFAERGWTAV